MPHAVLRRAARALALATLALGAAARAAPGKLNYGSGGVGSSQHLAGAMFKSRTGIDILHIPYKGSGPAVSDLLAGQVDMMIDTGSLAQVQAGALRALAVASRQRLPALPDVPTFGDFMRTEIDRYGAIVKLSGAKME